MMKKLLAATTALVALPVLAQAQSLQPGGFYIGGEGGVNWMLNTSSTTTVNVPGIFSGSGNSNLTTNTGWTAGGMIGYDFIGPRVEVEARYIQNTATLTAPIVGSLGATVGQVPVMANVLYDFLPGNVWTPYVGAGLGVVFTNLSGGGFSNSNSNAQFAYQAMVGVGYNIDQQFRVNLEGRYFGSLQPNYSFTAAGPGGVTGTGTGNYSNNNFAIMASLQFKFGAPEAAPPPPPPAPQATSFMVFFDWDRSNLSQQALATIQQAANAFKAKGSARITATGHTDTSGPENYNMALSLRRANAVKDALVRDGVPATAIAVIGRGEQGLLVPTPDGVREPQNRRVEIVLQ
jgi:outer membrane protein OmpA-like peptidoglycan-associated protein